MVVETEQEDMTIYFFPGYLLQLLQPGREKKAGQDHYNMNTAYIYCII